MKELVQIEQEQAKRLDRARAKMKRMFENKRRDKISLRVSSGMEKSEKTLLRATFYWEDYNGVMSFHSGLFLFVVTVIAIISFGLFFR